MAQRLAVMPSDGMSFPRFKLRLGALLACCLGLFIGVGQASAAPRNVDDITLPEDSEYIVLLAQHAEVLASDSHAMSLEDAQESDGWIVSKSDAFDMRDGDKTYWIRFGVTNPKPDTEHLVLDLRAAAHDLLRAYAIGEDGETVLLIETDADSTFRERDIAATRLNAQFDLVPGQTKEIYLQVDPYFATRYHFVLASELTFRIFDQVNEDWSLFWYGGMITVFVLAALAMPLIGWRVTAAFLSMIGCAVLTTMAAEGALAQYLFPNMPVRLGWNITDFFYYHTMTSLLAVGTFLFALHRDRPRYAIWVGMVIGYISILSLFSLRWNVYDSAILLALYRAVLPLAFLTHLTTGILSLRRKKSGATAFLLASLIPLIYAANAILFGFSFEIPSPPIFELSEFRNLILLQLVVIAFAIVQRYARIRNERDRALRTELEITQEKLQLSEELRESRENYDKVKRQSERQREQLSAVSHDILQPLQSLRSGLKALNPKDEATIQHMQDAFDYLESLARESLKAEQEQKPALGGAELFPIRTVTDVSHTMFARDAQDAGVRLRYRACKAQVSSDPIAIMRMVNNALSNAIRHASATSVLLACRERSGGVEISIRDNGIGMDANTLSAYRQKHARHEGSDGSGLGLALIEEEAGRLGIRFDICSEEGVGTVVRLTVPR